MDKKNTIIAIVIVIILFGGLIYLGSQQSVPEEPVSPETEKEEEEDKEIFLSLPANFVFGTIKEVKENSFSLETKEQIITGIKIGPETEILIGTTKEKGTIFDIKEGSNAICQLSEQGDVAIEINVIFPVPVPAPVE